MTYDEWRLEIANHLERNARSPHDLESGYDEVDGSLPRSARPEWLKLNIALSFWDGWIDAKNHQWRYYEPITEADWPRIALELAATLRSGREIENPIILDKFDHRPRKAK